MTMLGGLCDVCGKNEAIGVASTSVPMSVAYCRECLAHGADPEMVFVYWAEDCDIKPDEHRSPDESVTFKDDRYISYREWYQDRGNHD